MLFNYYYYYQIFLSFITSYQSTWFYVSRWNYHIQILTNHKLTFSFCLGEDISILPHEVGLIVSLLLAVGCRVIAGWCLWAVTRLKLASFSSILPLLSSLLLISDQPRISNILTCWLELLVAVSWPRWRHWQSWGWGRRVGWWVITRLRGIYILLAIVSWPNRRYLQGSNSGIKSALQTDAVLDLLGKVLKLKN